MAVVVERLMSEDIERGVGSTSKTHPSGGTLNGYKVNIGSFSTKESDAAVTATWDPGSIASGAEEVVEVTVTGTALGDFVLVSFSLDVADLTLTAQVTATDTVTVQLSNLSGSAVDLGSGILKVSVFKVR